METEGVISEIPSSKGGICFVQKKQGNNNQDNTTKNQGYALGWKEFEHETVITDVKCKRVERLNEEGNNGLIENNGLDASNGLVENNVTENDIGPKNILEAGPGVQARLGQ